MNNAISVIIAVRNGEAFIGEAIDSVINQSLQAMELLVVDDASTDGTLELLKQYQQAHPDWIKVFTLQENVGQGEAFNLALKFAKGEFISFLDADDFWFPNKLETVAAAFAGSKGVVIHQHLLQLHVNGRLSNRNFSNTLSVGDCFSEACRTRNLPAFSPTSGLSFKKEILDLIGDIPSTFKICADGFLTRTAICYGRVSATDELLGVYRVHGANHTYGNDSFHSDSYVRDLLIPELNAYYAKCGIAHRFNVSPDADNATEADIETALDALQLKSGDHTVMVRSAPPDRIRRILSALKKRLLTIDLLVQSGMESQFQGEGTEVTVHSVASGPMTSESISTEIWQQLRSSNPKCILIPYYEEDYRPYVNIHEVFAKSALTCPIVGISPYGNLHPTNRRHFISDKTHSREISANSKNPTLSPILKNNEKLRQIHQRFAGKRAFLIGNGPSLKIEDLTRIQNEITFASNKIFLAYDLTNWRPTVYSCCDEVVARNNLSKIADLDSIKVFANSVRKYLWKDPNAIFLNPKTTNESELEWDLIRGAHAGHSVLNLSIKIAYWMGIRELYIIGADHHFVIPNTKTGEKIMNNEVIVSTGERNHFHPSYRPAGETWTVPLFKEMEADFAESKVIFEANGGKIFNASRFSKLEVFEKVDFDSLF